MAAGIDIGNDGEQARESFVTYVQHRLTGFGGTGQRAEKRDLLDHPDFMKLTRNRRGQVSLMAAPAAIADVAYRTRQKWRPSVRSWRVRPLPRHS